ncbi:MAG: penicillin-binding protein 2 [Gammaproteobacteria bacterium]|nr:penicillin-binding protein 2 [Gammaproteobacteria bacterium]
MKNFKHKNPVFAIRRYSVVVCILAGLTLLTARAYELQVLNSDFLHSQGTARQQRVVAVPAHRGTISDRNNEPLAISTPVDSIWVNPEEFLSDPSTLYRLAQQLELDPQSIQSKLAGTEDREFIYIVRQLPPSRAAEINKSGLPGVYLQREYRRYYPTAEVAAHILGFTDIDDHGQEGIELAYDAWLAGHPGAKRVVRDRLGQVIENVDSIEAANPGHDLTLSIDRRLQFLAYRELKAAVQKHNAESGSLVLLDSFTGEVLAMVNQPAFNPHKRDELHGDRYRNRAVTDVFEPGSTMKPFTAAAALEYDYLKPTSKVNTSPGLVRVSGHDIKDLRNYGVLDLQGIFLHSSNVGATKVALSMPASELWHTYNRFGFGHSTGSGFPGESIGTLNHFDQWSKLEQATMSFGYGLSVTALQLAHAYSILANGGFDRPITLVRQDEPAVAQRVLSAETAETLRNSLSSVVDDGSGRLAKVPGYRIAGKTGTVRKLTKSGYSNESHMSVFAGMAPLSNPRLVMVVVVNKPSGEQYYGGQVAAPVFGNVIADALRLLNIPPDDPKAMFVDRIDKVGGRT